VCSRGPTSCDGQRIAQNQERLLRSFYSSRNFQRECRSEDLRHRKEFLVETACEEGAAAAPAVIYHSQYDKTKVGRTRSSERSLS
jgi:hypothetical protein